LGDAVIEGGLRPVNFVAEDFTEEVGEFHT
jgi:hypothetical protein